MPATRLVLWPLSSCSLIWCALTLRDQHSVLGLGSALLGLCTYATLGVFFPQSRMYGEALARGKAGSGSVALTFDDGPHPVTTRAVLEILRAHEARATFFLLGHKVEAHPEVVREISAAGHTLAIHGYEHDHLFSLRSARYVRTQIERTQRAILSAAGVAPRWFRPPIGFASHWTFSGAEQAGVELVAWSVRSLDGIARADPKRVAERVIERLSEGAIVLLHDAAEHDDFTPASLAALPVILRALRERQLRPVSIDQLAR